MRRSPAELDQRPTNPLVAGPLAARVLAATNDHHEVHAGGQLSLLTSKRLPNPALPTISHDRRASATRDGDAESRMRAAIVRRVHHQILISSAATLPKNSIEVSSPPDP
jgi:hypothetical protein